MRTPALVIFFLTLLLVGTGCAPVVSQGSAELPAGIGETMVPSVDNGGFLYYASDPPILVHTGHLLEALVDVRTGNGPDEDIQLKKSTIVFGPSLDEFGGSLQFSSEAEAQSAWEYISSQEVSDEYWASITGDAIMIANRGSEWSNSVSASLESGATVPLQEQDANTWALISNLPSEPPSTPVAVGAIRLQPEVLASLGDQAGVVVSDVGNAFGFVKVDMIGFGLYADEPVDLSVKIDQNYLKDSGASVLFLSQSGYPSGLVAFMLSVIAGRTEMELITLGDTNARYRQVEDLHLILKNKGSIIYGAVSGTRAEAEELMLSALAD